MLFSLTFGAHAATPLIDFPIGYSSNGGTYGFIGLIQQQHLLEQQGIRQIISRPKHPQTLGKVERFWGTLWRECLQRAVFLDLEGNRWDLLGPR